MKRAPNGKFRQANGLTRQANGLTRICSSGAGVGSGAPKHHLANLVGKAFLQVDVTDQKAHQNGSVEGVEDEIKVFAGWQFAPVHTALQGLIRLPASGPEKPVAIGFEKFGISLASGEERGDNFAALGTENANETAHLKAHIILHGAGVREAEFLLGTGGEGVGHESCFRRPPAVDCGLADVGVGGNRFDPQLGKSAVLFEQFEGAAEDRLSRLFAARPARRSFGDRSVVPVSRMRDLSVILSHAKKSIII